MTETDEQRMIHSEFQFTNLHIIFLLERETSIRDLDIVLSKNPNQLLISKFSIEN